MAKGVRILVAASLLILFTTENLTLAAVWGPGDKSEDQTTLITHEWHGSFSLLAESSEERDHRDYDGLPPFRALIHPFLYSSLHSGKIHRADYLVTLHDTTPRYTRFRTLII